MKPFHLKFWTSEIYQEANINACGLEIIDDLGLVFGKKRFYENSQNAPFCERG